MKKLLALAVLALASSFSFAETDDSFVFATYNVRYGGGYESNHPRHWEKRTPVVAQLITNYGFDVFGAQEPESVNREQLKLLADKLPGYAYVACPRDKDDGKYDGRLYGECVPIFFKTNRFECIKSGTFWLSATPGVPSKFDKDTVARRICTWARLKDKKTGKCFRYFNTHLDSGSEDARQYGINLILSRVREAEARGETVFLSGDLNDTLEEFTSAEKDTIVAQNGPQISSDPDKKPIVLARKVLADTYDISQSAHVGPYQTFHGWYNGGLCRIDYIFATSNAVDVLTHKTINDSLTWGSGNNEPPSDHYPVMITVSLANSSDEGVAYDSTPEDESGNTEQGGGGEGGGESGGEGGGEVTPGDASVTCSAAALASDESSIITDGTLKYAYCHKGSDGAYTVNGVAFSRSDNLQDVSNISVSPTFDKNATDGGDESVSGDYGKILKKYWKSETAGAQTWTFKNLTAGNAYKAQFIVHNATKSSDYTVTGPDGSSTVAYCGSGWTYGGTIIVSFTAKSTTQDVVLTYSSDADTCKCVNAVQLRDLGMAPEEGDEEVHDPLKPRPALLKRLQDGDDVIGIIHWGPNTYYNQQWGHGNEDPARLWPTNFNPDQIAEACAAGGLKGLVIVAKHHDGTCLWPTATTTHRITESPYRYKGQPLDYVGEMATAIRKAGMKVGIYCSPWDRNNSDYAFADYVTTYHNQVKELLSNYGEIFEMWFDGANGGSGYYGGDVETTRSISGDTGTYYDFGTLFAWCRAKWPNLTIFAGERDDSDFRWPGNEQGYVLGDCRATIVTTGGYINGAYQNGAYNQNMMASGSTAGEYFRVPEADFPMRTAAVQRQGDSWFYTPEDDGHTKSAAFLMNRYLNSVGNGATMDIGISPTADGQLSAEDVEALRGFKIIKDAFFAHEVADPTAEPVNFVVMSEDITDGEHIGEWHLRVNNSYDAAHGAAIGYRRMRTFGADVQAPLTVTTKDFAGNATNIPVTVKCYYVDRELINLVNGATVNSPATDVSKWDPNAGEEEDPPEPPPAEIPVYTLTIPTATGLVVESVKTNNVGVAGSGGAYSIVSNSEVTITFSAAEGYAITDGNPVVITITGNTTLAEFPSVEEQGGGDDPEPPPSGDIALGWTSGPMSATGDTIDPRGTLVYAFCQDDASSGKDMMTHVVNGVTYYGAYNIANTINKLNDQNVSDFFSAGIAQTYGGCGDEGVTDTDYKKFLTNCFWDNKNEGVTFDLTLKQLEKGKTYLVQITAHWSGQSSKKMYAPGSDTIYLQLGGTGWTYGGFLTGVFTASGTEETFAIKCSGGTGMINSIQVREVTLGGDDPEQTETGWRAVPMAAGGSTFSTNGVLVFAFARDRGDPGTTYVNSSCSVPFNYLNLLTDTVTKYHPWQHGGAAIDGPYGDGRQPEDFIATTPAFTGAKDNCGNEGLGGDMSGFGSILQCAWSGPTLETSGAAVFTLKGLTAGNRYLVEFFIHCSDEAKTITAPDGKTSVTYGGEGWTYGGILHGVFTATAATQDITLTYSNPDSFRMNAIQLRDLGVAPEEETVELVAPEFAADGTALALTSSAFSLTIANPVKDAYYTVFTAEHLTDAFTAETDSVLFDSDDATYTLEVEADKASKFAKIVVSRDPFEAGAKLP